MPPKTATKSVSKSVSKSAKGHAIMVGLQDSEGNVVPFPRDENPNYSPPIKVPTKLSDEEIDKRWSPTSDEYLARLEVRNERENESEWFTRIQRWFKKYVHDGERTLTQALEQAAENKAMNQSGMRSEDRRSPTTFGFLGFKEDSNGELMKDRDGKLIPYWQDREEGEDGIPLSKLLMMRKSGKKGGISKTKRISVIKRRKSKKNKRRYTRKNYPGE